MSNSNIYRQYDIRGIVDQELTDDIMFDIGRAFALYAREHGYHKILLGRDNRMSSPHYRDLLAEALLQSGCDVVDLGMVITPMFYYASRHLGILAGIMITASHNPGEYNGCKLLLGESTIYGDQIIAIQQLAEKGDFASLPSGKLTSYDIREAYMQMITEKIKLGSNKPKVVVDCGNGTASPFAPELFERLGCETIPLFCESDSTFPNHHPDPVKPENLQDLIKLVKQSQADIGIGIDGDGDRLGVVDRDGNMIWGDQLMILFWRDILPRYPDLPCIVEVKCSQSLIDEIKHLGGTPLIFKTGHSLIKAKMKETGAIFTGEMSGHMFFADDYYGYDDALYAAARLLLLLSNSNQSIGDMLSNISKYYSTPEIRLPGDDETKFKLVDQVLNHFKKDHEVIDIDGARIIFPHGWGLVRASNTGPEIICRCEGDSPEALHEIKNTLFAYLDSIGLNTTKVAV
ncbi:MAG: phosphoglucomutase/phosphomannomutase alpha/beta/alpha domain [Firmicutes bacterium]|nr:phosphoglucomutase/phosphomannomutase alpha/beta/alpha domain [Bacillota bacterium]